MKDLVEIMNLSKTVLKELGAQPLCRTQLEHHTVRKAGTHATFEGIFRYSVQSGYIAKQEQKHRADCTITDKGSKLLEAIQ